MACGYEHMIDDNGMQQMKYMYADMWMRNDDLDYSIIFDAANQAEDKYYLIFYATFPSVPYTETCKRYWDLIMRCTLRFIMMGETFLGYLSMDHCLVDVVNSFVWITSIPHQSYP